MAQQLLAYLEELECDKDTKGVDFPHVEVDICTHSRQEHHYKEHQ